MATITAEYVNGSTETTTSTVTLSDADAYTVLSYAAELASKAPGPVTILSSAPDGSQPSVAANT